MSALAIPESRVLPSEEEVRRLVAAVLEGVAPAEPATTAPEASFEPDRSPASTESAEVAVGADHGGYRLKERIVADLRERGFAVRDCGTDSTEVVDYPDFAHRVARLVADGDCRSGIVVDGAGIGSCMVANKVPGVRAATCWDLSSARNSREHNHANVLALGAGLIGESLALDIVQTWLTTPWGGDRHARRVGKIDEIERRYLAAAEAGAIR
ncbi:MAG TPA: ribose 5-phosphate isomerase B [Gaiellaceae bacterium]|nr:ribose 5-phosphate isomerase B [Gaiellaceae bacterium]